MSAEVQRLWFKQNPVVNIYQAKVRGEKVGERVCSLVDLGAAQYGKGLAASEMCALDAIQAGKQHGKTHINITYDHCQM